MKKTTIKKCNSFSSKGSFAYRVCRLLNNEEFSSVLSSQELTELLNEQAGKKIKSNQLTALMEPLIEDEIVKVKTIKIGKSRRKYWFPGWIPKRKIEEIIQSPQTIDDVIFFSGREAWTDANKNFPKIIGHLKGNLCVVDRYYGNGTLEVLARFGKKVNIRFLSCELGKDEQGKIARFNANLALFKKEFRNIKMRIFPKQHELHDRYVIAENALLVIGQGIKDLANKESFVIYLPKDKVKKVMPELKAKFEERWKKSNNLR